jgi:transposase
MRRIEPYNPLSYGVTRVDDRKVISGFDFVIRNGVRWRDAPKDYDPHKSIYKRGGSVKLHSRMSGFSVCRLSKPLHRQALSQAWTTWTDAVFAHGIPVSAAHPAP